MNIRAAGNGSNSYVLAAERVLAGERKVLNEESFRRTISLERKRTERSRNPFLLMLFQVGSKASEKNARILRALTETLLLSTRETDVTGWYQENTVIGVMFTEFASEEKSSILSTMLSRITSTLKNSLTLDQFSQVSISFHLFPDDWDQDLNQGPSNPILYPDLTDRDESRKLSRVMKRAMDIVGSSIALILFSPLFLAIAIAIKAKSKGPVFFRQKRIGQHGQPFTFLKFRSMYTGNDSTRHREYVQKLIAGKAEKQCEADGTEGVYKLTKDPRVTKVGAFLRKTSLDELPQFINVLNGEMSLVGPRPPVPYEVEAYDIWHRRRLLEAKPGITGLWQVKGRSQVKFDDMVRLDLQYARSWSPWLDLKIMMLTPGAVFLGEGAH